MSTQTLLCNKPDVKRAERRPHHEPGPQKLPCAPIEARNHRKVRRGHLLEILRGQP